MTNHANDPAWPGRRDFLVKSGAVCLGAVVTIVPAAVGIATVFDPLRRKSPIGDFVPVTSLNALPEDGTPRRFEIIADRTDAWNRFPQVPIGAVYLRRLGPEKVEALNVTCPHAGCPVDYRHGDGSFLCPCHDSKFNLDGSLFAHAKSPSPRGLDTLEVDIRQGAEVWVRFQNFEAGKAKKIPLA
jgi:Rieske Fe-S protein